ncbi:MAG: ribulose-phosphate 3-epimerase [bacterium]|nr:ribulose-phosphate 3-epimerase [bacterium]
MAVKIFPSILNVPKADIQKVIDQLSGFVDGISVDVMDGQFVPPTSFTVDDFAQWNIPIFCEVHLMVQHPELWIEGFARAGADLITIHFEAEQASVEETLKKIHSLGCQSGLALKPKTSVQDVPVHLWDLVDVPLIMSVEPGWGGQAFLPQVLEKVRYLRERYPSKDINIDGGITPETARLAREAGCTILVAGSSVFKSPDYRVAVDLLRD